MKTHEVTMAVPIKMMTKLDCEAHCGDCRRSRCGDSGLHNGTFEEIECRDPYSTDCVYKASTDNKNIIMAFKGEPFDKKASDELALITFCLDVLDNGDVEWSDDRPNELDLIESLTGEDLGDFLKPCIKAAKGMKPYQFTSGIVRE
jgi:hypothetical protein